MVIIKSYVNTQLSWAEAMRVKSSVPLSDRATCRVRHSCKACCSDRLFPRDLAAVTLLCAAHTATQIILNSQGMDCRGQNAFQGNQLTYQPRDKHHIWEWGIISVDGHIFLRGRVTGAGSKCRQPKKQEHDLSGS